MARKKIKRYIVTWDESSDRVVWCLYADLTVALSSLREIDIEGSETLIIDLTDY